MKMDKRNRRKGVIWEEKKKKKTKLYFIGQVSHN